MHRNQIKNQKSYNLPKIEARLFIDSEEVTKRNI
jgi:hypothetical protein